MTTVKIGACDVIDNRRRSLELMTIKGLCHLNMLFAWFPFENNQLSGKKLFN